MVYGYWGPGEREAHRARKRAKRADIIGGTLGGVGLLFDVLGNMRRERERARGEEMVWKAVAPVMAGQVPYEEQLQKLGQIQLAEPPGMGQRFMGLFGGEPAQRMPRAGEAIQMAHLLSQLGAAKGTKAQRELEMQLQKAELAKKGKETEKLEAETQEIRGETTAQQQLRSIAVNYEETDTPYTDAAKMGRRMGIPGEMIDKEFAFERRLEEARKAEISDAKDAQSKALQQIRIAEAALQRATGALPEMGDVMMMQFFEDQPERAAELGFSIQEIRAKRGQMEQTMRGLIDRQRRIMLEGTIAATPRKDQRRLKANYEMMLDQMRQQPGNNQLAVAMIGQFLSEAPPPVAKALSELVERYKVTDPSTDPPTVRLQIQPFMQDLGYLLASKVWNIPPAPPSPARSGSPLEQ